VRHVQESEPDTQMYLACDLPALRPPVQTDEIVGAEEELAFKFPLGYRLFLQ
jgi:hypothetical protein